MIRSRFSLPAGWLFASAVAAAAEPALPPGTTLAPAAPAALPPLQAPSALAIDDEGRILVAENPPLKPPAGAPATGFDWYLDDLAATQPAERLAVLEKWRGKIPSAFLSQATVRLRRFADPDGDGSFDQVTDCPAGASPPAAGAAGGLFAHDGAIYLGSPPEIRLLRAPDAGGAAPPKTLVSGLGIRVSCGGHGLSGFTLGPDGRLYGTIGDYGLGFTPAAGPSHTLPNEGCAFRFELDGSGFEILHRGLRQPCGVAFDAAGNAFTVDAGAGHGDAARIVYLVDGGDSGWRMEYQAMLDHFPQLGLTEAPPVAWLAEGLWELGGARQAAYVTPPAGHLTTLPRALTSHPGTGMLEAEAGRFLVADRAAELAASGIFSFAMAPDGAGMKLADSRQFVGGLQAADMEYTWDGKLIIADAGGNRLVTLTAGSQPWRADAAAEAAKLARENLDQRESADLLPLLQHPDFRIRLRAQFALTRKPDALTRFAAAIAATDATARLHGIWGVAILARRGAGVPRLSAEFGGLPDQRLQIAAGGQLVALLKHQDAEVRAQALRALGESLNQFVKPPDLVKSKGRPQPPTYMKAEALPLAALLFDPAPRVRYFAAIAIGKLKAAGFYGAIGEFLAANDNQDPWLRHAGSYALQHLAVSPLMLAGLERHPAAAVRLGAAVALRRMHVPEAATFINDPDPRVADEAIRAVTDLSLDDVRVSVAFLLDDPGAREWSPFMLRRLIHNAFRLGGAENAARMLKLVGNPAVPPAAQMEVLRLLHEWPAPPPVDQLTGHWRPLAKRDPAELKPLLTAELPRLFKLGGAVRAAALKLNALYQLNLPVPQAAPATP
jgi:quinoprotein glucose dehydrogenase